MFAFNGASWFLCDLLVCYAFTPFMSFLVQRAREKCGNNWRGVWLILVACVALRLSVDFAAAHDALSLSAYTFPPVRLIDYFMAYVCGCLALGLRTSESRLQVEIGKMSQTVIESVALMLYMFSVVFVEKLVIALTLGMICSSIFVLVFVFCRGRVSSFFSVAPFQKLAKIELEFYMVHQPCIIFCHFALPGAGHWVVIIASLTLTFVMAYVVKFAARGVNAMVARIVRAVARAS